MQNVPKIGTLTYNIVMSKNTSISLGNYFDDFIRNSIDHGRFKNASEVIRAGLRLLEEEESKAVVLKAAIKKGDESPDVEDYSPKDFLSELKKKKKNG